MGGALGNVVYVLTSAGHDFYSAMTRVSAASVRLTNPACRIVLVCDVPSAAAMERAGDPLLDEVDECLSFATPNGDDIYRNRFIKTDLRNLIDGPYLFLDSDFLVRGDLSGAFQSDIDVAAAPNRSKSIISEQIWSRDQEVLNAMGWQTGANYVNGGMLFFGNTPAAFQLAAIWHAKWRECQDARFGPRDQPSLNAALAEVGPRLRILDHRYNAQFRTALEVIPGAAAWHYYASADMPPTTTFEMLSRDLVGGKQLRIDDVKRLLVAADPWRRDLAYRLGKVRRFVGRIGRRALYNHRPAGIAAP